MSLAIKSTAPGASFSEAPLLLLLKLRTFIALFAVVIFFSFAAHNFLSIENLLIMSRHVALNAFLAIGMTFVIVAGGIDLSVGSVVGLTGMVAGGLILKGIPIGSEYTLFLSVPAVIAVALLVGVLVGAINGLLITRLNVAPFIATLGTLYIARGAALLSSGGETFPNLTGNPAYGTSGFPILGSATILGIPLTVWLLVVVGVIAAYIAARTPLGRQIYAVGANERAAQLSGVRVNRVKMFVYMFSGFCAAIVGLIIASELVASHPMSGETFELNAIAAAVLGGTSMSGGRGKIGGTIVGAFVIGMLSDGLVMMGVSSFWQTVIKGVVIVAAVVVDQIQRRAQQRFALQKQAATGAWPMSATPGKTQTQLKGALIGCGFFSLNHLHAWQDIDGARIVALCDANRVRLDEVGERFRIERRYTDAATMLREERLDFVDIATTVPSHRALVELAAAAGVATICQKPFASTLADARAMVQTCREAGVPLMVHENFRWQSAIQAVGRALHEGTIGQPFWGRVSFRSAYDVFSGQPYLAQGERFIVEDLGIHILDIARFLFGDVARVSATTARVNPSIRGEDVATILLTHENGVSSMVDCSYATQLPRELFPQPLIEVDGAEGTLRLFADFQLQIHTRAGTQLRNVAPRALSWTSEPWVAIQGSVFSIQSHWVDCLRRGVEPATSGRDNLRTLELVEATYLSAREGRTVVPGETAS